VLKVAHRGDPASAKDVAIHYSKDGKLVEVRGKAVIMAGWNGTIPYMMPELPTAQKEALAYGVKGPMVYTSVAVTNWRPFVKLVAANFHCPDDVPSGSGPDRSGQPRRPEAPADT